jgi:hypothetical protein
MMLWRYVTQTSAKPIDPEQLKRFIDISQEGGADNDADALDRAFKKIVPPKRDETQKRP